MKIKILLVTALAGFLTGCVTYSSAMGRAAKAVLGPTIDGYKVVTYPTDNFGLATSYKDRASADTFLDDGVHILGLEALPRPTDDASTKNWLQLGGFASYGDHGGIVQLTQEEQTKVQGEVMAEVQRILTAGAVVDWSRGVTTTLTINQAYPRFLRRTPFIQQLQSLDPNNDVRKAWDARKLVVVVADVVVSSMTVTVTIDTQSNAALDTKLSELVAQQVGLGDAKLRVAVQNSGAGTYQLHITRPVIIATRALKQPAAGVLAAGNPDEWEGWTAVSLDKIAN